MMSRARNLKTRKNTTLLFEGKEGLRFIIFDTETTGIKPEKDRIVELAAIKYEVHNKVAKEIDTLHIYIKPPFLMEQKIVNIHGITNEFLMDKPTEENVFNQIKEFFGKEPVVAGHNIAFDIEMLNALYMRQGEYFTSKVSLDTLEMARDLKEKYSVMLRTALDTVDKEIAKYKDDIEKFRRDNPGLASKLDYPVNIGSPTQIAILFYDILKLKSPDKDHPRGTGKDIMKSLDHPIGNAILEYRKVDKLLSTYIEAIPAQVNRGTGRLHCNFNPIGAKTGRFSSSDPNLQNIPSHNKDIRPMFTVEKDWVMIGSDFSQQEPRILAFMSGDDNMKQAYLDGLDLYANVASALYHVPYDQCLEFDKDGNPNPEGKKRRTACKSVLLGLMYGRGEASIAEQMGVSTKEAKKVISNFFERFPKVADFVVSSQDGAWENGFVETIAGRKRRLPDMQLPEYDFKPVNGAKNENFDPLDFDNDEEIDPNYVPQRIIDKYTSQLERAWGKQKREIISKAKEEGYIITDNGGKIADAERQCVNSRIQGSAADMTKVAMILVDNDPILKELDFHLLIPVHDELLGECPRHNADKAGKRLSQLMIEAGRSLVTDIPQKCDVEITERWYGSTLTEEDLYDETEDATE